MAVHLKYWLHDTGVVVRKGGWGWGTGGTEGCYLCYYIPLRHGLPHILTRQILTHYNTVITLRLCANRRTI
jgi:hypothetical protein